MKPSCPRAPPLATSRRQPDPHAARRLIRTLHGSGRLAVDGTLGLTDLVENLHHNILRVSPPLGPASQARTRGVTGFVYRSIRGVTRLVGATLDALLGHLSQPHGAAPAEGRREAVIAALNGVLGDHLVATGNPLAISMTVLHQGRPLVLEAAALADAITQPRPRVLLMLHGLCMHPGQWRRDGLDMGSTLAHEADCTLLHLHYNTGLHVAANGRALADRLEAMLRAMPWPVEELTLIGHSMGGLVARSALHQAQFLGHGWPLRTRSLVCLGSPHHGAPLERGGHGIDTLLHASPYTAAFGRLGRLRSAGITDLRHGGVHVPLPAGVDCYALAGALKWQADRLVPRWVGDGLVPVDSALGRHADPARCLDFPPDHTRVVQGVGHLELMSHPEVLAQLRRWLVVSRPA